MCSLVFSPTINIWSKILIANRVPTINCLSRVRKTYDDNFSITIYMYAYASKVFKYLARILEYFLYKISKSSFYLLKPFLFRFIKMSKSNPSLKRSIADYAMKHPASPKASSSLIIRPSIGSTILPT